jgi:hypothetical protein
MCGDRARWRSQRHRITKALADVQIRREKFRQVRVSRAVTAQPAEAQKARPPAKSFAAALH